VERDYILHREGDTLMRYKSNEGGQIFFLQ
jgi:hypothetical protein